MLRIIIALTLLATFAQAQMLKDWRWDWNQLIADTLIIPLPIDSTLAAAEAPLAVVDQREQAGPFLGIRQIKKMGYIPVDQYLVLPESLSTTLSKHLPMDPARPGATLVIDNISIWYDGSPLFLKGWTLNGLTRLVNDDGATLREWQWEHRGKMKKKQKPEDAIGRLVGEWLEVQTGALNDDRSFREVSPYRYRRQLLFRVDTIILPDGYILNGHFSLDFPADQLDRYIRGVPGMEIYYRKSSLHESIAIGGKQQQWLIRLRPSLLGRLNFSFRIGGNSFNTDKFDYLDWWNIFLVNLGLTTAVEYRPPHYKGLFAGIGLHQSINVLPLPDVVPPYTIGLLLTAGVILP